MGKKFITKKNKRFKNFNVDIRNYDKLSKNIPKI